ncbi:MAG TPA: histidine phosphatase family protein [Anaerolineales bacterium]|nr:histidine phosphatase family protein [Anaerolineales bacterium]
MAKIFLARHASPDRDRKDIPYDIHPGPPLSPKGEQEAAALADFLKAEGVQKLYYSPFERAARTAQLIAARNGIPATEEQRLAEWREADEKRELVHERMWLVFEELVKASAELGPVAVVSHGGPITFLLLALGLGEATVTELKMKFDRYNPLPPAGAWSAEWKAETKSWELNLAFVP